MALSLSGRSVIIKKIGLPAMTPDELEEASSGRPSSTFPSTSMTCTSIIRFSNRARARPDGCASGRCGGDGDEYAGIVERPVLNQLSSISTASPSRMHSRQVMGFPGRAIVLIDIGASTININIVSNGITTFTVTSTWVEICIQRSCGKSSMSR